jgi:hypothetical protein
MQDYSGANRYCTDDLFSIFFAAMQSFCEQAEYIEAYGFFCEVFSSINEITPLKSHAAMFRLDEMPDGVTGSNHMIDCPQNQPGPSCYPNQNGQKFLNP